MDGGEEEGDGQVDGGEEEGDPQLESRQTWT